MMGVVRLLDAGVLTWERVRQIVEGQDLSPITSVWDRVDTTRRR